MEDHAICTFYLTVGLWVSHRCPVHTYVVSVAKFQEFLPDELRAIILMMELGTPNRWIMSMKKSTVCSALILVMGRTSIHLENLSIATSK